MGGRGRGEERSRGSGGGEEGMRGRGRRREGKNTSWSGL